METPEQDILNMVLRRMHRCRVCHRPFGADDVQIVSRSPEMWMMVVECTDCHSKNFVAAVLNEGDAGQAEIALRRLSEQQMITPAPEPIAHPPAKGETVTASDVVDMHEFLGDFDGDFRRFFAANPPASQD